MMTRSKLLSEDEIIRRAEARLLKEGYGQPKKAVAALKQRGPDLVMKRGNELVVVEAKGARESHSPHPFSSKQKRSHVMQVLYEILSRKGFGRRIIALPDDARHRDLISTIETEIQQLSVEVWYFA